MYVFNYNINDIRNIMINNAIINMTYDRTMFNNKKT